MRDQKISVKRMVLLAMLAALAYVAVTLVRIPVVLFLNYEPKDVIITVSGFLLGPMASLVISGLVALVEMFTISDTGPVGCLMNLLSSCCFACTAAFIYKKRRSLAGAVLGLCGGTALMVTVMLLWNWLITPMYMGVDRQTVEGMLMSVFLPFNLLKAGLNSALTLLLYKPIATALRRIDLAESRQSGAGGSKMGVYILAGVLLATCVLFLLVMQGVI